MLNHAEDSPSTVSSGVYMDGQSRPGVFPHAGNDAIHEPSGQQDGEVTRNIAAEARYERNLLLDLFHAFRQADREHEQKLRAIVRDRRAWEQLRVYLDGMLAKAGLSEILGPTTARSPQTPQETEVHNRLPRVRPSVMDVQYLCSNAPYRVPAKPWTTVTDSDDLVSHLVSLYLTWGYPFYAFFCPQTFLHHMKSGRLNSDFCSPFLVNALLANACFYSDYSEAYSLPGDVKAKGAHFLAEAEQHLKSHQFESGSDIRLASLQATLLMYERYSLSGRDHFGYIMLNRAIEMAESLGIVNNTKNLGLAYHSEDMTRSLKRTAWGLFQIDTIVHMNFLRHCRIQTVNLDPIDRHETRDEEFWIPYPLQIPPRMSYMSVYFDEACRLSHIARDLSWDVGGNHEDEKLKQKLYTRLCQWEKESPSFFDPAGEPAPYVLLLRMRYHTLIINLCCHDLETDMVSSQTKRHAPDLARSSSDSNALTTAVSSAREIASLVRAYREAYELEYTHQFAMYAINVSLFCMLTQKDFDILDPDFLDLTTAFAIVASRSQVGRHVFHAFKLSVRSMIRNAKLQSIDLLPSGMQELFRPRESSSEADRWDHYAEGLAEVDGDQSFLTDLNKDPETPGLHDMLRWYERLSIGTEAQRRENDRQPAF